ATKERKIIEIAEQISKRDLDIVGIQESWEKKKRGDSMQSLRVRMDREKEERDRIARIGGRGVWSSKSKNTCVT
ncbi:hypothetical protein, partial [Ekhidna sp.]